ncbi:hypothetical protein [Glycomyces paridis]|uniref:Uncharacterized protein n=1 Tax=Glycomyces paridis TaxID=2126555 RepID=A0A4S8PI22_9ACTN|nr:hypothetical protein [Glycomyces paridis]THV30243.1 hypothetical protein E9998_07710 [Glycomyces paridis]
MASIDEVLASISANTDTLTEAQGQIEASKAITEETLGQLQALNVEGAAAALGVTKDQLEECSALAAALVNKLGEALNSATVAKGQ